MTVPTPLFFNAAAGRVPPKRVILRSRATEDLVVGHHWTPKTRSFTPNVGVQDDSNGGTAEEQRRRDGHATSLTQPEDRKEHHGGGVHRGAFGSDGSSVDYGVTGSSATNLMPLPRRPAGMLLTLIHLT